MIVCVYVKASASKEGILLKNIDLFVKQSDTGKRPSSADLLLIASSTAHSSQGRARPEPGAWSPTWISQVRGRNPSTWVITYKPPQELLWKCPGARTRARHADTGRGHSQC